MEIPIAVIDPMVTTTKPAQVSPLPSPPTAMGMPCEVRWEKLPDDYRLPDDPVDNINQPFLAAALTDGLRSAGDLSATTLTPTNYGICATYNGQIVVKAPDWAFIPQITVSREEVERSYTPQLQGDFPTIVLEFVSAADGGEYSTKPTHPPGKWFFYERILKVPTYGIFDPALGLLELYRLNGDRYELEIPDEHGRHWIAALNLFLGPWQGMWDEERVGYWLRWWNADGSIVPWMHEKAAQLQEAADAAQQQADQATQRAEAAEQSADVEKQRADRLAELLRAQGINPDEV